MERTAISKGKDKIKQNRVSCKLLCSFQVSSSPKGILPKAGMIVWRMHCVILFIQTNDDVFGNGGQSRESEVPVLRPQG